MSNKKNKNNSPLTVDVLDAELAAKPSGIKDSVQRVIQTAKKGGETAQAEEDRKNADLQKQIDSLFNQHKEKGSMAFELLKSAISQRTDSLTHGNYESLVAGAYQLADEFKQEMDVRWTTAVTEHTSRVFGIPASDTVETTTTEPSEDKQTLQ